MTEIWRPVVGHEGYEVSSLGRVRSLDRTVLHSRGHEQGCRGRVLAQGTKERGHKKVRLAGHRDRGLTPKAVVPELLTFEEAS
ncbi:MAG: NUMOD4 domain-containing protein [Actinomycetota bacterium]|nr:NUMOD4 domain-containing protein [Actinomycetota bacterium]